MTARTFLITGATKSIGRGFCRSKGIGYDVQEENERLKA
jgi:short-subunit dehydrogenase